MKHDTITLDALCGRAYALSRVPPALEAAFGERMAADSPTGGQFRWGGVPGDDGRIYRRNMLVKTIQRFGGCAARNADLEREAKLTRSGVARASKRAERDGLLTVEWTGRSAVLVLTDEGWRL